MHLTVTSSSDDLDPVTHFCSSAQAIACTVWLIILPPRSIKNTSAQNIKIILECDEGSVVFICCIFAYDILLALMAFIFAFIARKLEDHFR